jgi:hypothetical protein
MLTLNREALTLALDSQGLEEYDLDALCDYHFLVFDENPGRALINLCYHAFMDWGALTQTEVGKYTIIVYALDSENENCVLVTVRENTGPLLQLSSLTLDVDDDFADNIYTRQGPGVLIDVLQAVVDVVNNMLGECEFKPNRPLN